MTNKLQQYFPMIRTKEQLMAEIEEKPKLKSIFYSWKEEARQDFINFCTGARGVKMMYDFISKEILNPEIYRERANEFLSLLLNQKVKILEVLPNDGTRLADESTLLIMDIVVELEDGSIVNLEIQKIGYMFPGERSACYSADLLLRQYKRVKQEAEKKLDSHTKMSYKDIKDVYTIVLFQQSPQELKKFKDVYMHRFKQESDTGAKMNLLQKYLFVTLDNFNKIKHNNDKTIKLDNRLEAWLAFLSMDAPEDIVQILEQYPDFKALYNQVYDICLNIEEVMGMFSKELLELDRNTVELMIDEMQKQADNLRTQNENMTLENEKLGLENEKLGLANENLTFENENLTFANENLMLKNENLALENENLTFANESIKNENESIKSENESIKSENESIKNENKEIRAMMEELKRQNEEILKSLGKK